MNRTYEGHVDPTTNAHTVTVDGSPLDPHVEVVHHTSTFAWGYLGSGPAQLALAILLDHVEHHPADLDLLRRIVGLSDVCEVCDGRTTILRSDPGDPDDEDPCWNCQGDTGERSARALVGVVHQAFKVHTVAGMPQDRDWTMSSEDVRRELAELVALRADHGPRCNGHLRGGPVRCPGGGAKCPGSTGERVARE